MAKNSIGQFIAALRKANGMTQQDVADRLNVSNKAVSRWERDECAPDISALPAIAEMFGVTCDELLKGERNRDNDIYEKKEAKVDKQVKNLINRTLSGFKTLIWISLTLAIIGLICMFGISYGFYRPVIGFAVMLLFEACALAISVLAVSRTKDVKSDNELFEMADSTQIERFNKVLGSLSFWAFYAVFSSIIISLPFVLISSDYVESVITPNYYFTFFFGGIVMILLLVYLKCKKPYMSWIANGILVQKEKNSVTVNSGCMTLIQIALTVIAGLLFVIAPYFETRIETTFWQIAINVAGLVAMLASIAVFGVFILKHKDKRSKYLLSGIRNIVLLPAALIVVNMHKCGWIGIDENHSFTRYELWFPEYLLYAIAYCIIVLFVFTLIDTFIKSKCNKKND
ncbi:MAG: helix-turn-helix domain-containing protein [Ruminiclostridium sp.]